MHGGQNKNENRLWLSRKKRGLEQKQVAHLLNHKSLDQISRYESGSHLPRLNTALKLEIIYGVPLRVLFTDLYAELCSEIKERAATNQALNNSLLSFLGDDQCSFADLIESPNLTRTELSKVRDHVTQLAKRMTYL